MRVTSLEMRAIESILQMGGGYVLDFGERSFAQFFGEYDIQINEPRYCALGTSKANRLRCFLQTTAAPLTGRVLGALLQHRIVSKPDGIAEGELKAYSETVERLGGSVPTGVGWHPTPSINPTTEAELLQLVFRPELLARLPVEPAMSALLAARMDEARRCIECKASLSAVILCGSVLEGMCLGFGCRHPERVNRAYAAHYCKSPKQFPEWKLKEWVDVLGCLGDLSPNIEKFGHSLRDFRNYVHPAEQLAHQFAPDQHTARIGYQVVVAAADDLVQAEARIAAYEKATS